MHFYVTVLNHKKHMLTESSYIKKTREITVGDDPNAPCIAYGDDSGYEEILTYAFAIVHRVNLEKTESAIVKIKEDYRIPNNISLHCRILFNLAARQNNNLGYLKDEDIKKMVVDIIDAVNDTCLLRYAYFSTPLNFNFDRTVITPFQSSDGSTPPNVPIKYDRKGILGLLMQLCFAVPPDGKKGPPSTKCQIFASEDYTKIHFIGPRRSRADHCFKGFSDIGAPLGYAFKLNPVILKSGGAILFQVADIFSYICSHALSKKCKDSFFKDALNQIRYKTSGVLNLDVQE